VDVRQLWDDLTASDLAMSGSSLIELIDALGHMMLVMIKRYSQLSKPHVCTVLKHMTNTCDSKLYANPNTECNRTSNAVGVKQL
jgi:hypothetical protein